MTTTPGFGNLQALTDAELMHSTAFAILREREAHLAVLYHLIEIERRRLHLKYSFASMYHYARERLKYSSGAAHRRIASARALQRYSCVHEALKSGRLTLTTTSILAGVLKDLTEAQVDEIVERAAGKSQEEVQELVATLRPQPAVREKIVPVAVSRSMAQDGSPGQPRKSVAPGSTGQAVQGRPAPAAEAEGQSVPSTQVPDRHAQAVVEVVHRIQFSVTPATLEKFKTVCDLLAGRFPTGPSIEQVFETLLDHWIDRNHPLSRHERREKRQAAREGATRNPDATLGHESTQPQKNPGGQLQRSRHVPAALRDETYVRAEGQCKFVGVDGKRCEAKRGLEIEHRQPFARGGETSTSNCDLFCHAHNQLSAREAFGDAGIDRRIRERISRVRPAISTDGDRAPSS